MHFDRLMVACLPIALALAACTKGEAGEAEKAAVATELTPGRTASSLALHSVVDLVKGDIADVKTLEAKINDPEAKLSAVDLDDDGITDFIEVIEVKEQDKVVLQLRAIPSNAKVEGQPAEKIEAVAAVVAEIELHVEDEQKIVIHATYTEHLHHDVAVDVVHHEQPVVVEHGVIVVADDCFYHHVFVHEHVAYHGHYAYIVIDAPVVHVEHVKHKKHKKHHGKHKGGHGHGHGNGVVVTW